MSTWNKNRLFLILLMSFGLTSACGDDKQSRKDDGPRVDTQDSGPGILSDGGHFRVKVEWTEPLSGLGRQSCRLVFTGAGGDELESLSGVTFKPWMTSMDHGGATRSMTLKPDAERKNVVVVSGFQFGMGGPWDLLIEAVANGHADEATVSVEVPE